jgi:ribosomal protein S9
MKRRRPISLTPSTTTKSAAKKSSVSHSTPISACEGHTKSEGGGSQGQAQARSASVARALLASVCGRPTGCWGASFIRAAFIVSELVARWCIHRQRQLDALHTWAPPVTRQHMYVHTRHACRRHARDHTHETTRMQTRSDLMAVVHIEGNQ